MTPASPPVWGAAPDPVSPDPDVSPDAPRRERNRKLALIVVAVVAVVALAVVGWARLADPGTGSVDTSASTPQPSDPGNDPTPTTLVPPTMEEITAEVVALSQFVEQQRGLNFKEPVAVEVLTSEEFSARVAVELNEDASRLEEFGRLLSALGLINPQEDFVGTITTLLSSEALGYYDPAKGAIVVAADRMDVMTRRTIVHELVHALDDQWFDLDRPGYDDLDDETAFGFSSVVEGNAARVDTAWVQTLSEPEQRELFRLESLGTGRINPATVPPILYELLYAPYLYGFDLVTTLLLAGGEQEVDRALIEPPSTSSAVLWPERYISGFEPTPVATPPADSEPTDSGMFGELLLRLSLASALLESEAVTAARGWRGDAYVMWRAADDNDCVRVDTQTANSRARDLLTKALTDWTSTLPDASTEVLDGTSVRFTSCSVAVPVSDSASPL